MLAEVGAMPKEKINFCCADDYSCDYSYCDYSDDYSCDYSMGLVAGCWGTFSKNLTTGAELLVFFQVLPFLLCVCCWEPWLLFLFACSAFKCMLSCRPTPAMLVLVLTPATLDSSSSSISSGARSAAISYEAHACI